MGRRAGDERGAGRGVTGRHLLALFALSAGYESLFVGRGIGGIDEAWPLYAAMRLHAGGILYADTFFVFPPGHVLPAWLGAALAPPGIAVSRALYAAFNVALCGVLYLLGRRLMPPRFALLAAALLAIAAPHSHLAQYHFGYRYLLWSALALLAFARRDAGGDRRWMLFAGIATGLALAFRLTPAFAAASGIGVGVLARGSSWTERLRDAGVFAFGVVVAVAPVLVWAAAGAGLEALWREAVARPLRMTSLQQRPLPDLALPAVWTRDGLATWFTAFEVRAMALLYAGYAAVLLVRGVRVRARREAVPDAVLLAVVTWGGVYFARAFGRSDIAHIESTLPPACLLFAHLVCALCTAARARAPSLASRGWLEPALCLAIFASWGFAQGSDRVFEPGRRGPVVEESNGEVEFRPARTVKNLVLRVETLRSATRPDDTILDLSASPFHYVLSGRPGPGFADVVMPGTFRDAEEERQFVERLRRSPPAAVVWPRKHFDRIPERGLSKTAPEVLAWVRRHYERFGPRELSLLRPKGRAEGED